MVVIILYTISQIFSLAFPFVDVGLHYKSLNLLQIVCFASLSVALIIALAMVPHAWSYWWFSVELQRVFWISVQLRGRVGQRLGDRASVDRGLLPSSV